MPLQFRLPLPGPFVYTAGGRRRAPRQRPPRRPMRPRTKRALLWGVLVLVVLGTVMAHPWLVIVGMLVCLGAAIMVNRARQS